MIYVLEAGCRYEGGGALGASTSLTAAWKAMRKHRIYKESEKIGSANRQVMKLSGRWFWLGDYDYCCIREYAELGDTE